MFNYFNINDKIFHKHSGVLQSRQNRKHLSVWNKMLLAKPGDILSVIFRKRSIIYRFEGICIGIKNKMLQNLNSSLLIRIYFLELVLKWLFYIFIIEFFFLKF